MTRRLMIVATVLLVVLASTPAHARDEGMNEVFTDGLYGAAIGALLGTAVMVMTDHPSDHFSYISTGAALGVIGGTAYGLARLGRYAMIDIEHNRVAWRVPTIETTVRRGPWDPPAVTVSAALVSVRF